MTRDKLGWWPALKSRLPRVRVVLAILAIVMLLAIAGSRAIDPWLRKVVESRMNSSLRGYTAQIEELDLHLLGLALDLDRVTVLQQAHPDPPVLHVPRLTLSIQWRTLFFGRLVADCVFVEPALHANLVQLQEENRDEVPFNERGWQEALEGIYPLKINELRVLNASLVYQDESEFRPLRASGVDLIAHNIRNVRSKEREYPSTIDLHGTVFDSGRVEIHGNADFLADPRPAVKATLGLLGVDLGYFDPVLRPYSLSVKQGLLNGNGMFESAANVQIVDLDSVVVTDATIDYVHGSAPIETVKDAARKIEGKAREAMNDPETLFRIRHLKVENGTIGFVNQLAKPVYRLYVADADFELENLSSRSEDGVARAVLGGTLMGTGVVNASASFFPEGKNPNFEAKLEIAETQLKPMNGLLLAHGKFDVVEGVFSLYTEVRVKDGYIDGYVKPMFRDLNVYDPRQDKKKNVFRKMYEGLVGGVAKILENRKRDEVVTVAKIQGPVSDPNSSTLGIIGHLIQNAFFEAILPGFDAEVARGPHDRSARRVAAKADRRRRAS